MHQLEESKIRSCEISKIKSRKKQKEKREPGLQIPVPFYVDSGACSNFIIDPTFLDKNSDVLEWETIPSDDLNVLTFRTGVADGAIQTAPLTRLKLAATADSQPRNLVFALKEYMVMK